MKTCKKCGIEKPYSEFYKAGNGSRDGHEGQCKGCKEQRRKERLSDPEVAARAVVQRREYYEANKDKFKVWTAAWDSKNRERKLRVGQEWRVNNRDRAREITRRSAQKRRAMEHEAMVEGFRLPEVSVLVQFYGRACLVPGCTDTRATLDHVVPLIDGGKHTYWNSQPLCHVHNCSKGRWHSTDYRPAQKLVDRIIT